MANKYRYPALKIKQSSTSKPLVLLAAPATEIEIWAGTPQKARIHTDEKVGIELVGFQRDLDDVRSNQIAQFYSDPMNVIQNPLLCAIRQAEGTEVKFEANSPSDDDDFVLGWLTIDAPELATLNLLQLIRKARAYLEMRVPELSRRPQPEELIRRLRRHMSASENVGGFEETEGEGASSDAEADEDTETEEGTLSGAQIGDALFEPSHITDFWDGLVAREHWLEKLDSQFTGEDFIGISRSAMEAYLRPIILVDGQHRLQGALRAAENALNSDETHWDEIKEGTRAGVQPEQLQQDLLLKKARRLPISLLLNENADEHVFQFVVVNQKATAVRPALLGTIISTSLAQSELGRIADRLVKAGIPLESSMAATFFSVNPHSPFYGRIARGFSDDNSQLLPWSVLGQLVAQFRNLRGAKYFHNPKIDYADLWRRKFLPESAICTDFASKDFASSYEYWQDTEGPWRDVFIQFWAAVRDKLANSSNTEAPNYWGSPRTSNLFNKPSLLTLSTDFFAYLVEVRQPIASAEAVKKQVEDWLADVKADYFARDWKLTGVKKDSPGTRKQWASLWYTYRRDPKNLPFVRLYSSVYKGG